MLKAYKKEFIGPIGGNAEEKNHCCHRMQMRDSGIRLVSGFSNMVLTSARAF